MQVPSELESTVHFVAPLVHKFRDLVNRSGCPNTVELEVRLGTLGDKWEPNVGAFVFNTALDLLQTYDSWSRVELWQDSHDYFYTLPDGQKVRTSVHFNDSVFVTHVQKVPVALADVKLVGQPFDARVSVKTETPVAAASLPKMVEPYMVRIKKRCSFTLDKWRFDLTQVWSGMSRSIAEANQARNFCSFEIEIECVCPLQTLNSLSDEYIALSMLLKICSLLGVSTMKMMPLIHRS